MARDNGGVYVPVNDPASFYFTGSPGDPNAVPPVAPVADPSQTRQPAGTGGGGAFPIAVGNAYYRANINPNIPALKSEIADTWTLVL